MQFPSIKFNFIDKVKQTTYQKNIYLNNMTMVKLKEIISNQNYITILKGIEKIISAQDVYYIELDDCEISKISILFFLLYCCQADTSGIENINRVVNFIAGSSSVTLYLKESIDASINKQNIIDLIDRYKYLMKEITNLFVYFPDKMEIKVLWQ